MNLSRQKQERQFLIDRHKKCLTSIPKNVLSNNQIINHLFKNNQASKQSINHSFKFSLYLGCGENDDGLRDVDNHPHGGQGGLQILRMRRPNRHWHHAHKQTAVEGGDEVHTGRIDERNMVARVESALL